MSDVSSEGSSLFRQYTFSILFQRRTLEKRVSGRFAHKTFRARTVVCILEKLSLVRKCVMFLNAICSFKLCMGSLLNKMVDCSQSSLCVDSTR